MFSKGNEMNPITNLRKIIKTKHQMIQMKPRIIRKGKRKKIQRQKRETKWRVQLLK